MDSKTRRGRLFLLGLTIAAAAVGIHTLLTGFLSKSSTQEEYTIYTGADDDATTIMIDPGHGRYDSGSLSMEGIMEKDITLQLGLLVGEKLTQAGYHVEYTRTSDDVDWESDNVADLQARVAKAVEADAECFVSIHTNSSDFGVDASGFETYVDLSNEQMTAMAQSVHEQLGALDYSQDRGLKDGIENQLYVICDNPVAAMLIEVGFISNASEHGIWSIVRMSWHPRSRKELFVRWSRKTSWIHDRAGSVSVFCYRSRSLFFWRSRHLKSESPCNGLSRCGSSLPYPFYYLFLPFSTQALIRPLNNG